jgi:RHS repeat-associated protein
MRALGLRLLAVTLAFQQLTFAVPARALVNAPTGVPVDAPTLAQHAGNPGIGVATRQATGDVTFRIPIEVPPGTGGHTPQVALGYSSGDARRNGPLGVGWRLDVGPAMIERSTRDGAPRFDASDEFELAGQRLRETGTPGRYVAENHDFSRIEHLTAGGNYWRVLRPDGTRLYYGFAPGSDPLTGSILYSIQVDATDPTSSVCPDPFAPCTTRETIVDPLVPFAWYLDRIEDRNGNVIRLQWEDLFDRGMRYLTAITYSEHVAGSTSQVPAFGGANDGSLTRQRAILFQYDLLRTDFLPSYRTGFPRQISYRLAQIDATTDASLVRRYLLEYEQSPASGRSRLVVVRERDASGSAANERVHEFSYGDGGTPVGGSFWSVKDSRWALPAGLQFVSGGADQGIRLLDVNTDGYPDVVRARSGTRRTYLGGPDGFDSTDTGSWALPFDVVGSSGYNGVVFGDFDGDGRQDLLRRLIQVTGINEHSESCGSSGTNRHHEVVSGSQGTFVDNDTRINTGSGWALDASQAPGYERYTTSKFSLIGNADSCPYEYVPTADRVSGLSAGFDQGARVLDMNSDGRDDLVYYRGLTGGRTVGTTFHSVDETRAGTILNSEAGLGAGTSNFTHYSLTDAYLDFNSQGYSNPLYQVDHSRFYDQPEWQIPEYSSPFGFSWSNLNTCKATSNVLAGAHSGKERMVDVNGDGLPDILEHVMDLEVDEGILYINAEVTRAFVNNGYGWKQPSLFPETVVGPPIRFYAVAGGTYGINSSFCTDLNDDFVFDYGTRILDLNGDGGPDVIGNDDGYETLLWSAEVQVVPGSGSTLWYPAAAWDTPVTFRPSTPPSNTYGIPASDWNGPPGGARLADVNNDGMVDIVVSDGAYLNLASPPDLLEGVATPYGATASFQYEPHTVFGAAPRANATTDGQYVHTRARWVVTRVDVDPGAAFGQPLMSQEFEYYDPIYDVGDRGFRGFREVVALGPVVDDVREATQTFYHTSDALRGRAAQVLTASVDVNGQPGNPGAWAWTWLRERHFAYAHGSGASATATVTFSDGSTGTLGDLGDTLTPAAFASFAALLAGSPAASEAFLAYAVEETTVAVEGQPGGALESVLRRRYDAYGNPLAVLELGDPADANDDITTGFEYAVEDRPVGGDWLYLANRPFRIIRSGQPGGVPLGTLLSRTSEILYDGASGSPQSQTLVRGNATAVQTAWTDPQAGSTFARSDSLYDVYGNPTEVTSRYDVAGPGPEGFTRFGYDPASATRVTQVHEGAYADPDFDLVVDIEYEIVGCGAPPGLDLPCRVTDPNGQVETSVYDDFGRLVSRIGPNGAAMAALYHDADRGTANQRREVRIRWDAAGPADPAGDPHSLVSVSFTDGLGRVLEERRSGRGSDVAGRMHDYDAAGRVASTSRWDHGALPVQPTTFGYDAIGRTLAMARPDGTVRSFSYLPRETIAETTLPAEGMIHRRALRVDAFGRLREVDEYQDPAGSPATTSYVHDAFGNVVRVRNAVANDAALCNPSPACPGQRHVTDVFFDELGNRVRIDDPDSGTWLSDFDARGLVVRSEDPRGKAQTYTYDALGRLVRRHAENPMEATEQYDDTYLYGLASTGVPNGIGRLVRAADAEGYDDFAYDAAGNASFHRRVALGRRFDFTRSYDPLGRVLTTAYPDGETASWHYDKGLLARISSAGGSYAGDYVADIGYDALDRPLSVELGGSAGAPVMTVGRSYDAVSGRLSRIDATVGGQLVGKGDYTIDGAGRVRVEDIALANFSGVLSPAGLQYQYDGLDRLVDMNGFRYEHDALGNLLEKDSTDYGGAWGVMEYGDPLRPHALTHAAWTNGSRTLDYTYDEAGNVRIKSRVGPHGPEGSGVAHATLLYDSLGRAHRVRVAGGRTTVLRYGALGQRLGTTQWEVNGDANGDGVVGIADFNLLNLQFGSTTGESADFNGDLVVGIVDYNILSGQFGQTVSGPSVVTPEPDFEYHPSLARVNKHFFVAGARVASSASTWSAPAASLPPLLTWRGPDLVLPPWWAMALGVYTLLGLAVVGAALRRREPRLGLAGPRLRLGTAGVLLLVTPTLLASPCNVAPPGPASDLGTHGLPALFYATDHLGSTILTFDSDGVQRNRFVFMPFGDPGAWQQGLPLRHRFAGEEIAAETGFYVLGQRLYDPEIGRFLQPDPLVFDPPDPQSFNRYTYALDNPLSWVDPTGLAPVGLTDCGDGYLCSPPTESDPGMGPWEDDSWGWPPGPNDRGPDWWDILGRDWSPPPPPSEATNVPISGANEVPSQSVDWGYWGNVGLEAVGWGLTAFDVVNTVVSPTPDTGILGASMITGARAARAAKAAAKATEEMHHLLPQAERFRKFFDRAGLDIEDFKIPLDQARHRLNPGGVHTNSGGNWNRVWDTFFKANPNATRDEILQQLGRMRADFGI